MTDADDIAVDAASRRLLERLRLERLRGLFGEPEQEPSAAPSATVAPDNPLVLAQLGELVDNLDNCRETFRGIETLEASILRYGLLENLVGVEIPEEERARPEAWIEIKAGSRRLEAIRRLIDKGQWPVLRPIPIVLRDSRGFWENLVENVQRLDIEPWEIGRRLSEASGSGSTHQEIGLHIGRTTGWVTRHIQIGRGLSPETIDFIGKNKLRLSLGELGRLSFLRDRFGDPDGAAQVAAILRRRRRRGPKKRDRDSLRAFSNRITYLREQMGVPPHIRPVVEAVLDYLDGGGRPNFRQLTEKLLGDKRRLLGADDLGELGEQEEE